MQKGNDLYICMANYFTLVAIWGVLPLGSGLFNDAGFQIMSKQFKAQRRPRRLRRVLQAVRLMNHQVKIVGRTPDAPNMEILLAKMLVKIDE